MYNTKFVQKLAFAYRNCPLSLETTKHFQTYINSLLRPGIENFPKCDVYDTSGVRGVRTPCLENT